MPDGQGRIRVDIYSLVSPEVMRAQALKPFTVNLPPGSHTSGMQTVWLKGEKVGEVNLILGGKEKRQGLKPPAVDHRG